MSATLEKIAEEIIKLDRAIAAAGLEGKDVSTLHEQKQALIKQLSEANKALEGSQLLKG